jgi:16S rRNA (cytosine967-C5)-methyltransferase
VTPGERLAAAVWDRWLGSGGPLDRALGGLVRAERIPGPVSAEAWGLLGAAARVAGWLCAWRDPGGWLAAPPEEARRRIGALPDFWRGVRNPPDRAAWRAGSPREQVSAAGVGPWWTDALLDRFGAGLSAFLATLDTAPPLWLRVRSAAEVPAIEASLRADGYAVERKDGLALAVRGSRPIGQSSGFRAGTFEVQDLASQRVVDQLPAGAPVWDACAGEGGKTLAIAARLGGRSAVWASDAAPRRLEVLRRRVRRAGWQNVRVFTWTGEAPPDLPREAGRGFPLVLVDAPCSASGTWRRNPEVRLGPPASQALLALQGQLLRHASAAVAPGGALALATCSFDRREDEEPLAALGWPLAQAGLHGPPRLDSDTLFLGVLRRG